MTDTPKNDRAAEPTGVEIIEVPNRLKAKLHAPGGKSVMELVGGGQHAINAVKDEYPAEAHREVQAMRAIMADLRRDPTHPGRKTQRLLKHAHNVKGQAGTFDYMLLTLVADSLVKMIERLGWHDLTLAADKTYSEVVELHLGAMDLILKERLKGDGGGSGKALLDGLHKATAKRMAKLPDIDEEKLARHTLKQVD